LPTESLRLCFQFVIMLVDEPISVSGGAIINISEQIRGEEIIHAFENSPPRSTEWSSDAISVCVPMYNEEFSELEATLKDLYKMQALLKGKRLLICIIQDGWGPMSQSVKNWMSEKLLKDHTWTNQIAEIHERAEKRTVVFREASISFNNGSMTLPPISITVVVKVDNRKKHNSHDIFCRGFALHHKTELVFATDCGTKFKDNCLAGLVKTMEGDMQCIAATGRQRVMNKWQQPDCENEDLWGAILRIVQGYDYDASTVMFNGCFSLWGSLPVIPGPCGLFRLRPLLGKEDGKTTSEQALEDGATGEDAEQTPFGFYATSTHAAENSQSLQLGNTVLAEDRVLTHAAKFLAKGKTWKVKWNNRSIFYFQSEVSLKSLVFQRRRWINGTVAAYIFVVSELGKYEDTRKYPQCWTRMKYRFQRFLNFLMLWTYLGTFISPAVYIYLFHQSVAYLLPQVAWLAFVSSPLMFARYVAFQWRHFFVDFDMLAFSAVATMNAVTALTILVALGVSLCSSSNWLPYIGVAYVVFPVFLNLLVPNGRAVLGLINPFRMIVNLLMQPTFQGYFLAYAVARTYDLRWGNRDGVGEQLAEGKSQTKALIIIQNVLNLVVLTLLIIFHATCPQIQNLGGLTVVEFILALVLFLPSLFIALCSFIQAFGRRASTAWVLLSSALPVVQANSSLDISWHHWVLSSLLAILFVKILGIKACEAYRRCRRFRGGALMERSLLEGTA